MPAFTPPPPAPQRGNRSTFSARVDAFLTWLVQLVPQLNSFIAGLNSRDVGGANTYIYTWDGASADSDPGMGNVRFSALPLSASTIVRLANLSSSRGDISSFMASLASNASNTKGAIRFQKIKDPTAWMIFQVSQVVQAAGYWNLVGVVGSSSSANPFESGDDLAAFIDRSGDKGDGGGTPTQQQIRDAIGTVPIANGGTGAVDSVNALNNLGGLARAGGEMTGSLTFGNSQQIIFKDAGGIGRIFAYLDQLNITNLLVAGGNRLRILSQNGQTELWNCDNRGVTNHANTLNVDSSPANSVSASLKNTSNGNLLALQGTGTNPAKTIRITNSNFEMLNSAYNAVVLSVTDAGVLSAPVVTQTSDERLKTNWRVITDEQLDAIADMHLSGVFDWVAGGSSAGGSAQAIRRIIPEVVYETEGKLHVDYGGLNFAILQANLRRMKERGLM